MMHVLVPNPLPQKEPTMLAPRATVNVCSVGPKHTTQRMSSCRVTANRDATMLNEKLTRPVGLALVHALNGRVVVELNRLARHDRVIGANVKLQRSTKTAST